MSRNPGISFLCVLTVAIIATSCKPRTQSPATPADSSPSAQSAAATPEISFKTSFQTESQFVVEAIVSDLAEEMYFAAKHRLPDKESFSVTATERMASPDDVPIFDLEIRLDPQSAPLKMPLTINGPIWSADVYSDVAKALASAAGLRAVGISKKDDSDLVSDLLDAKPETIERYDLSLSAALEKNFTNPHLHQQAALLLGAFLLREHSGHFFENRLPLSRMTAHLAMAHFLGGPAPFDVEGQLAEAILLTREGDQALALEKLKNLDTTDNAVACIAWALTARNTGDFRSLSKTKVRTPFESITCFVVMQTYVGSRVAWDTLKEREKQTIDFVRIANEVLPSVQAGSQLFELSLPLEEREIQSVYRISHGKELKGSDVVAALNETPTRCFTADAEPHVRIIGWGQWAIFLQRQLCHATQRSFHFLNFELGVPDEANKFALGCEGKLGGLRLYPFVRRFDCTNAESYRQTEDEALKLAIATPQWVPSYCWRELSLRSRFAPLYVNLTNSHFYQWHSHNPLPGTAYDLSERLNDTNIYIVSNALDRFEQLHKIAPYALPFIGDIMHVKYNSHPTYEQAMELYGPLMPWSVIAIKEVARTLADQPAKYEATILQAVKLDPACYYDLGNFAVGAKDYDKAAEYRNKACAADPDPIRVATVADWRMRYYLEKGDPKTAREIADFAGEVYSFKGLEAKADFMELTSNYDDAFNWYAKIEERYNDSLPVVHFIFRYVTLTKDRRFDPELKKRGKSVFPDGMTNVTLADFRAAPATGVQLMGGNALIRGAGMKKGDIIVAIGGVPVHNVTQYDYVREFQESPQLDLIVWHGNAYKEVKASPPNLSLKVKLEDYKGGSKAQP